MQFENEWLKLKLSEMDSRNEWLKSKLSVMDSRNEWLKSKLSVMDSQTKQRDSVCIENKKLKTKQAKKVRPDSVNCVSVKRSDGGSDQEVCEQGGGSVLSFPVPLFPRP